MKAPDAYTESFASRGSKYDQAMRLVPDSRSEEFQAVVAELPRSCCGVVLDVPAGGGYLRGYLPATCDYIRYEPVDSFSGKKQSLTEAALVPFPQDTGSVDVVVSVAGIHHFAEKTSLFEEMFRVARSGGQLILADVHQRSDVATFLDDYVDSCNSTGHRGYYLGEHTLAELQAAGWRINTAMRKHYHWQFSSEQQLAEYCHLMFDMLHSDFDRTLSAIRNCLGIDRLANGKVGMRWDLLVIAAEKER